MARGKKTKVTAVPEHVDTSPRMSGMLIDLMPVGVPSGYPVHGTRIEYDSKGKEVRYSCGGLCTLPEEVGLRTPDVDVGAETKLRHPIACTQCTKRTGRVVLVDDELFARVLKASEAAGVRRGQLPPQTLTLGHLSRPARIMLNDAYWNRIEVVKIGSGKTYKELYDFGLLDTNREATALGRAIGDAAGWRGAA